MNSCLLSQNNDPTAVTWVHVIHTAFIVPPSATGSHVVVPLNPVHLGCHTWMNYRWEEQWPRPQQEISWRATCAGFTIRGYQGQSVVCLVQQKTVSSLAVECKALRYISSWRISFIFGKTDRHRKWMILPIVIKSCDPAQVLGSRTQNWEGLLSLAQIGAHLAYNLDRHTYT